MPAARFVATSPFGRPEGAGPQAVASGRPPVAGVVTGAGPAAVAVVMAARGYPEAPERGSIIRGLDRAGAVPNVTIFHAGTTQDADGTIRAAGGRVLTICATGPNLQAARDAAYKAIGLIDWPEGFCRNDIGWRALPRP